MLDLSFDTVGLALGAGLVAAVNPCGFALLPAYLSMFVLEEHPQRSVAVVRALRATAALTLGFAAVFAVFGLAIAPVAGSVQGYLPGFTVVLGLLVGAAGFWVIAGRSLPVPSLMPRRTRRGGRRPITASLPSMVGFGASYAIVSLGCTIAPFLAVVVTAFRAGSIPEGLALFLAYAAGMGLVVGTAAVAVSLTRAGMVRRLRAAGSLVVRPTGVLLVAAGGYVAWYGAWELRVLQSGVVADPVVETGGRLQRWLADTTQGVGAWGFLAVLLALLLAAVALWRRRIHQASGITRQDQMSSENDIRTQENQP
jgi:cytochrome c-type biogenesis protein